MRGEDDGGCRAYFRNHLLKDALAIGLTEDEFWHKTPASLEIHMEAFGDRQMAADRMMWMMGGYVADAVAAVLSDRKHPHRYPEKPRMEEQEANRIVDGSEWDEDEKEKARMAIMAAMGFET